MAQTLATTRQFISHTLRIVAFSDYRVQDISLLLEYVRSLEPPPDLLLYAGDDVERFQTNSRNFFEQLAACAVNGLCAVIGNDETEAEGEVQRRAIDFEKAVNRERAYIQGKKVYNVHETPLIVGEYVVIGNEGAGRDEEGRAFGAITYEETSIARHLGAAAKAVKGKRIILVSHTPPRGTLDLAFRMSPNGHHIGSVALQNFLLSRQDVSLVVCGHAHYCGAQSKKLGRSVVVNAASHDDVGALGRIAIIEIQKSKVSSVKWHFLWELTSIPEIGASRESLLKGAGIRTTRELADTSEQRIAVILNSGQAAAVRIRARALSLCKQELVLQKQLSLPKAKRAYLDLETDLGQKSIRLVGLHLEDENQSVAFYADTQQDEKQILSDMLQFVQTMPDLNVLSYSGSRFEKRVLLRRLAAYEMPISFAHSIRDIYSDIHASVAFPVTGLGLKEIAAYCGFKWRDSGMDGFKIGIICGSSGKLTKANKRMVIRYNEDDLLALKHVVFYLEKLSQHQALAAQA
ncbi:MAG TPA: ribonuclease H-like domain-containing protein [Candidatus Angelobacter sp.]|nr:ribonuclease H-like domain-containing protein [Candidatus Angelobacter sp.]